MNRAFIGITKAAMNGLYQLFCAMHKRKDMVLFLSRQSEMPSYDYQVLAKQVEDHGWQAVIHLVRVRSKENSGSTKAGVGLASYALHVVKQLRLLAQCRMAVLDRYDPVIGLLDFGNKPPKEPTIVQLWHAFGAYKKFGHQSIGTAEGHAQATIDAFNIHGNYSWVAASGEGARVAYAEAFNCPIERVLVFNRPEYYELLNLRKELERANNTPGQEGQQKTILFAPTLRKNNKSPHPFKQLYEQTDSIEAALQAKTIWSFHPLEEGMPAPGNVNEQLLSTSVVVTDYSSIVYEAFLLGKPVVFYIPDLDMYLRSPGLNANPQELCPSICTKSEEDLVERIGQALKTPGDFLQALGPFTAPAFEGADTALKDLLDTFMA